MGCDPQVLVQAIAVGISIHAPQWGATGSIHRPGNSSADFNPRTPVGCDQHPERIRLGVVDISIRAPQWGATSTVPSPMRRISYFNPRTPVGCDRSVWASFPSRTDFNPRTPVGCDIRGPVGTQRGDISIHAPQWGATAVGYAFVAPVAISIHAPQWGATWFCKCFSSSSINFNPRTPVGCDKLVVGSSVEPTISIHAPQWGATAVRRRHQSRQFISIHAPQWGATRKRRRWTRRRKYFNPRTPVGCDGSRRNR